MFRRSRQPNPADRPLRVATAAALVAGLTLAAVVPSATAASTPYEVPSAGAPSIVDSIGINVHENYFDTTYAPGGDTSATVRYLKSLGVKWIRISIKKYPPAGEASFLQAVKAAGIQVLAIVGATEDKWGDFATGQSAALIKALSQGPYANRVQMLELPNETDLSGAASWLIDLQRFNDEYYKALKAAPSTRNIPILGSAMGSLASCKIMGSLAASQELINVHPYTGTSIPETASTTSSLGPCVGSAKATPAGSTQKVVATELGYNNSLRDPYQGVSEAVSATYLPRAILWNYFNGVSRSFIYELFDQKPDPSYLDPQQHFGLVRVTGDEKTQASWRQAVKPSFQTVANLIQRLDEPRAQAWSAPVVPRVTNAPEGVQIFRINRPDGSVDVAVWSNAPAGSSLRTKVSLSLSFPANVTSYSVQSGAATSVGRAISKLDVSAGPDVQLIRISRS